MLYDFQTNIPTALLVPFKVLSQDLSQLAGWSWGWDDGICKNNPLWDFLAIEGVVPVGSQRDEKAVIDGLQDLIISFFSGCDFSLRENWSWWRFVKVNSHSILSLTVCSKEGGDLIRSILLFPSPFLPSWWWPIMPNTKNRYLVDLREMNLKNKFEGVLKFPSMGFIFFRFMPPFTIPRI